MDGLGILLACIALANAVAVVAVLLATRGETLRVWQPPASGRNRRQDRKTEPRG